MSQACGPILILSKRRRASFQLTLKYNREHPLENRATEKVKKQITAPVLVEMKLNLSRTSFLTNLSIKGLPKISAISREGREDLRNYFSKPFWGRPIVWAGVLLR